MKKTLFFLSIILLLSNCKKNKKNKITETNTFEKSIIKSDKKNKEVEKKIKKDSLIESNKIRKQKIDSINNINTLKTLSIVYVVKKNGIEYRKEPNIDSEKLGIFDYGTKLAVLEKTNIPFEVDENSKIKGKWVKVKSDINRNDKNWLWKNKYRHIGYVFSSFIQDSTKIDFSKLPILANSIEFPRPKLKEKTLNLSFTIIDSLEFNTYNKRYSNKIIQDSTKNISSETGGSFLLKTNKSLLKFVCGKDYHRPCYNYIGLIEPLHSYIIGQWGESVYYTFLIDKYNNSFLSLDGDYDGGMGIPVISLNNKKMLTYGSCDKYSFKEYYDSRSIITIYNLENIRTLNDIKSYSKYRSTKWAIDEIIWIDDNTFLLSVYDDIDYSKRNEVLINNRFLKAKIIE